MRGHTGAVLAPLLSRGRKAKCSLLGFPAGELVALGRAAARCSSRGCARAPRGPAPPAAGCSKPGPCPLGAGGASSGPDWARPAGRAGWGRRTHRCRVSVMFWLIQGTRSATPRSLKRHFKPAGDPSSIAGSEPRAALGFVPPATAMLEVLSPSPACVPVPTRAQAGRAPTEQDLGGNVLNSVPTCWLQPSLPSQRVRGAPQGHHPSVPPGSLLLSLPHPKAASRLAAGQGHQRGGCKAPQRSGEA